MTGGIIERGLGGASTFEPCVDVDDVELWCICPGPLVLPALLVVELGVGEAFSLEPELAAAPPLEFRLELDRILSIVELEALLSTSEAIMSEDSACWLSILLSAT